MATSCDLVLDLLRNIRAQFYFDRSEKAFFWDESLLKRAITFPAQWLASRGLKNEMPAEQYRALLIEIITTIKRHGNTSAIHSFGRYFLKAVQEHMSHHGEDYYDRLKAVRSLVSDVRTGLRKVAATKLPQTDSTLADLAAIHKAVVKSRGGRKKKQLAAAIQPSLFETCAANAGGVQ